MVKRSWETRHKFYVLTLTLVIGNVNLYKSRDIDFFINCHKIEKKVSVHYGARLYRFREKNSKFDYITTVRMYNQVTRMIGKKLSLQGL